MLRSTSPAQPAPGGRPPGYLVQLMTADYTVMGNMPASEMPLAGLLNMPNQVSLTISSAKLRTLHPQAALASHEAAELTLPKSSIILLVPRDDPGKQAAARQLPARLEGSVVYAGPFVIQGKLPLAGDMPQRNLLNTGAGSMIVMVQAQITCQVPGTPFPPMQAEILLLNRSLIQLYHPTN